MGISLLIDGTDQPDDSVSTPGPSGPRARASDPDAARPRSGTRIHTRRPASIRQGGSKQAFLRPRHGRLIRAKDQRRALEETTHRRDDGPAESVLKPQVLGTLLRGGDVRRR